VAFRVVPLGTGDTSLSSYVAMVAKVLDRLNVKYELTPMNTVLELGSLDDVLHIVRCVVDELRSMGVKRIAIDISMDLRFDKESTIEGKLRSVREKLGNS